MKILQISPQAEPEVGGIATFTSQLAAGLAARGHRIEIVSAAHTRIDLPDESDDGGVHVHRVPFLRALDRRSAADLLGCRLRVAAIKRRFQPDVIQLHLGGPVAFLHLSTAGEAPAPLIVSVHDLPPRDAPSPTLAELFAGAARLAVSSQARLDDLQWLAPDAVPRAEVVYPAVPSIPMPAPRARDPHPLVLTGGRHVPEKGLETAVRAFAEVHAVRADARLTITGDGPQRAELAALCDALQIAPAVHMTGAMPPVELAGWRRRAWVTLVPSLLDESFGLVALEAMRDRCPVVASRVGGLPEVVDHGRTGWLVPAGDASAMAAATLTLIDDPDLCARMGEAAQQRAEAVFGFEHCVNTYERLFIEACAR